MSREKQLVKNTLILSLGTLGSKVFSFLLLPLYTAVLTTEDYGNVDVLQSVIQLVIPLITLQLSGAIFRFLIDEKKVDGISKVVTSSYIVVMIDLIIAELSIEIVYWFVKIPHFRIFQIALAAGVIYNITQSTVRGLGDNALYSFCGFISVLSSLVVNIILILGFNYGGESILIAYAVSGFLCAFIMFFTKKIFRYIDIKEFDKKKIKEELKYCLPLIPNEISWWIANSSDRFIILAALGSSYNGIYAAANKVPALYTTVYNVFNVAWIESVSRSFDDTDRDEYINRMTKTFNRMFICVCIFVISFVSLAFKYLVGKNYSDAYFHVLILIIAVFFHSANAFYGGIYTGFKDTKIIAKTTIIGALLNIVINITLINYIGLYAASLSTLISYFVISLLRVLGLRQKISIKWDCKFLFISLLMLGIVCISYSIRNDMINFLMLLFVCLWAMYINRNLFKNIIITIHQRFK